MKIVIGEKLITIQSSDLLHLVAIPIDEAKKVLELAITGIGKVRYDRRSVALEYQLIRELQEMLGHTASAEQVQQKLKELEAVELANFEADCHRRLKSRQNEIRRCGNVEALAMLSRMIKKAAN